MEGVKRFFPLVSVASYRKASIRMTSTIALVSGTRGRGTTGTIQRLIGCIHRAHKEDATLDTEVSLENLACKKSRSIRMRLRWSQAHIGSQGVGLATYACREGRLAGCGCRFAGEHSPLPGTILLLLDNDATDHSCFLMTFNFTGHFRIYRADGDQIHFHLSPRFQQLHFS